MNVFRLVMIAFMIELTTFSLIGCKSKSHEDSKIEKHEKVQPEKVEPKEIDPQPEERIEHDDVEVIRLWGFEDACQNCNRGYRTKLVCGYAYNPECEKVLKSTLSTTADVNMTTLILEDIISGMEVKDGRK